MTARSEPSRLRTGIPSLDDIVLGGLPKGQIYLVEGDPGTGKTTLGMQFILEGKRTGEPCLYVTLSESRAELQSGAQTRVATRIFAVHRQSGRIIGHCSRQ